MKKNKGRGKVRNCSGGAMGTFIIKVDRCQENTWQGRVTWADEDKQVNFRSALELLKLMDEAINQAKKAGEEKGKQSAS